MGHAATKKSPKYLLLTLALVSALTLVVTLGLPDVIHADGKPQVCGAIGGCSSGASDLSKVIKTIINIMSTIGAVIAVIMIIVGGLRYITSNGDSNSAASARNTIIYALIGLVVVAFAQVIVQFVLERTT